MQKIRPFILKIDKEKFNYHGFEHNKVNEMFGGELTYIGTFCVNQEYEPVAVYRARKPDKSKGHKEFMLLQRNNRGGIVRGMTRYQLNKHRYQHGMQCTGCEDVIYSVMRHDYRECHCRNASIDGGKDYIRASGTGRGVTIDLLTGKVKVAL